MTAPSAAQNQPDIGTSPIPSLDDLPSDSATPPEEPVPSAPLPPLHTLLDRIPESTRQLLQSHFQATLTTVRPLPVTTKPIRQPEQQSDDDFDPNSTLLPESDDSN